MLHEWWYVKLIRYAIINYIYAVIKKQMNWTTKKRDKDIRNNTPYLKEHRELSVEKASYYIRQKERGDVEKNKTQQCHVGDYVRDKLSQLNSQIRKMIKPGYITH